MAKLFARVLVAYDGSEASEDALALALRLVDPAEGALMLGCVVERRGWGAPRRPGALERELDEVMTMLADARVGIPAGIHVELHPLVSSSAARGLTELAEAERAELIVVGSAHGAATDGRIGLARTAGRLLQGGPCAVAVAPPALREDGAFRHVGVAVDGSPESSSALGAAYAIALASGSAMTLYSVIDTIPDSVGEAGPEVRLAVQERLDSAADSAPAGLNPRTAMLHGAPGRVIAEACDGIVDLLVCGSRGYGPLQRALLGSVSEELIARSRQPVLVMPRPTAAAGSAAAA